MRKKDYIIGIIVNIFLGVLAGVVTEFALIYNNIFLIKITQSELFWVLVAVIVSMFSKNYLSTLINTLINLICMTDSYYIVRLIKFGYANTSSIMWYGVQSVCVALYIGTLVFLIKDKIKNKKVKSMIPKLNIICMTLAVPFGEIIWKCFIHDIRFQTVYVVGICVILGFGLSSIIGMIIDNKKT